MKDFIQKLSERHDLTREEAATAMRIIMEGQATDTQIAGFLIALKLKGEHPNELLGFVEVMREKAVKVTINDPDAVDLCGTGGDGAGTFNISTVASFVVAGAGVTVAKHGNRSISSSCGSADVLRALGVNIDLVPEKVEACINTIGIGFLFAPLFHPAMKYAAKVRSELGVKTAFNLLGPMTNPAGVKRQLVGAFSQDAARKMASVFTELGSVRVLLVHAHDGLDEVSLDGLTTVFEVNRHLSESKFNVESQIFGLPVVRRDDLRGGSAETNAEITMQILEGKKTPHRDIVLANAAFGLLVAGRARTAREGVLMATESIDSRNALTKLNDLRSFTQR